VAPLDAKSLFAALVAAEVRFKAAGRLEDELDLKRLRAVRGE